ncbi:hypothetical protein A5717_07905 [Mycolicibacterium porcinum]|nr:hypothetical protein A5717_07905 [Mycolicibacterium porcinum]
MPQATGVAMVCGERQHVIRLHPGGSGKGVEPRHGRTDRAASAKVKGGALDTRDRKIVDAHDLPVEDQVLSRDHLPRWSGLGADQLDRNVVGHPLRAMERRRGGPRDHPVTAGPQPCRRAALPQ